MPVLERQKPAVGSSRTQQAIVRQPHSQPKTGWFRQICLTVSNAILQFPIVFELQQAFFRQPELLRAEIDAELEDMQRRSSDFVVLDYGCGSGTYSGLVRPQNYIGIDINKGMIERACEQHPNHVFIQAGNLSGIKEGIGRVSQVFMIGVIHHLSEEDLLAVLSDLPSDHAVRILSIDTLKCTGGLGKIVQLFERGEFLRTEQDHKRLLHRIAGEISYKTVRYGSWFELAIFRGIIRKKIV